MKVRPAGRALILATALAASLWTAFAWNPEEERPTVVVAARAHAAKSPSSIATTTRTGSDGEAPLITITRPPVNDPDGNPFRSTTWSVPPPPPPPMPVQPPAPPPFSWSYLGRFDDGDRTAILLGRQEDSKTVYVGDTLDGTWRLSAIGEHDIEFVYLPLNMKHHHPIGARN